MKFDIYSQSGKKLSAQIELKNNVFKIQPNEHSVYLAVKSELAAKRQGTHSSKTKGEVAGTGAKPWRQKGTGRARAGHWRNPARVHGGTAFGPKPHKYNVNVNRKVKLNARRSILSDKIKTDSIRIVDELKFDDCKTKSFVSFLNDLGLNNKKVSCILGMYDKNIYLSSRNLHNVKTESVQSVSIYDLINCDFLILDKKSIEYLNNNLSN